MLHLLCALWKGKGYEGKRVRIDVGESCWMLQASLQLWIVVPLVRIHIRDACFSMCSKQQVSGGVVGGREKPRGGGWRAERGRAGNIVQTGSDTVNLLQRKGMLWDDGSEGCYPTVFNQGSHG